MKKVHTAITVSTLCAALLAVGAPAAHAAADWVPTSKAVKKALVADVNRLLTAEGDISRPVTCFKIRKYDGDRRWLSIEFKYDIPDSCGYYDGFGVQVWSGGPDGWEEYVNVAPSDQKCYFMGKSSAADRRRLVKSGICTA